MAAHTRSNLNEKTSVCESENENENVNETGNESEQLTFSTVSDSESRENSSACPTILDARGDEIYNTYKKHVETIVDCNKEFSKNEKRQITDFIKHLEDKREPEEKMSKVNLNELLAKPPTFQGMKAKASIPSSPRSLSSWSNNPKR